MYLLIISMTLWTLEGFTSFFDSCYGRQMSRCFTTDAVLNYWWRPLYHFHGTTAISKLIIHNVAYWIADFKAWIMPRSFLNRAKWINLLPTWGNWPLKIRRSKSRTHYAWLWHGLELTMARGWWWWLWGKNLLWQWLDWFLCWSCPWHANLPISAPFFQMMSTVVALCLLWPRPWEARLMLFQVFHFCHP